MSEAQIIILSFLAFLGLVFALFGLKVRRGKKRRSWTKIFP